jgi:predicted transcriptional regulator
MIYKMKDKRDRNERLRKFAREHPDYTHQALADIFHISRSRVSRILKALDNARREG